jgi:carboxypeptidase T
MRVVCVALLFLALIAPTCTCSSTASASTLDAGDTTPLRSLQDEKVVFPRVYTALVTPPKSDDDIAVHFVAQVDLLDVKEISSTEDSSVRVTFLVHGADELAVLTELLAKVNDSINSINIQLDLEQTRGFQVQADSSPPDNENVFASRQQTTYSTISGYSCYRDLQGSFDWMNDMVTKAELIPNLSVTLADIGDSHIKTVNPTGGHDIMAMKITGAPSTGDKAIFFAMSGIHAREYSPPETLMRWAEQLVDAYGNDADLSAMLDHTEIHLVIQTNPDGRAEAETQRPLFRRKNLNRGASASLCGSGQYGVDLNRNFPFRWGLDSGSSSNECSQTYRGTAPASEPEVQAVVNYCLGIFPEGQRKANPISQQQQPYNVETTMGIFFDIHSFGEVMIWPWVSADVDITRNKFVVCGLNCLLTTWIPFPPQIGLPRAGDS